LNKKNNVKHIIFLTGTRADYGKIKPLLRILQIDRNYSVTILVTGMHLLAKYGNTLIQIENDALGEIVILPNQFREQPMEVSLSKTIEELSGYLDLNFCDLLVVHGDRIEALAGAVVGAIRNVPVAHIEGGEVSGTIDGVIRHSVSKLSHVHFVSNSKAKSRLLQLGESPKSVHVIGSPDIDIMLNPNLPSLSAVREHYRIPFENYGILIFHPVTTELSELESQINEIVSAVLESELNYVVIKPNNDSGSHIIQQNLTKLQDHTRFVHIPSMRFEFFLGLLKEAKFIIGNSSAGVREAPYFGVPAINIGSRQRHRAINVMVVDTKPDRIEILKAIIESEKLERCVIQQFGSGDSALRFKAVLDSADFWPVNTDKIFIDS
jgi:UDP-N-acetylglucosamine 2-epimerase (hydrolysing)